MVPVVNTPPASAGDRRDAISSPGSGRSPGGGHGSPLQYSCLENPVVRGTWWATVHRVAKSWTQLRRLIMHSCMEINTKRMSKKSRTDLPLGTSLVIQWLRLWAPSAGGLSFIPCQGTRYHMLQLRVLMLPKKRILHGAKKIPHAVTRTQSSEINREMTCLC